MRIESDEEVLVVPTSEVLRLCDGREGVVEVPESEFMRALENGFFVGRSLAENDETIRQVIPYVVLVENGTFVFFRRTANQTEKRLHNLITLGVGGHVTKKDGREPLECFRNGLWRELREEVVVDVLELQYRGLINETGSSVSRVHVGVLYVANVRYHGLAEPENFVELRSKSLRMFMGEMEGWARVVATYLERTQS